MHTTHHGSVALEETCEEACDESLLEREGLAFPSLPYRLKLIMHNIIPAPHRTKVGSEHVLFLKILPATESARPLSTRSSRA